MVSERYGSCVLGIIYYGDNARVHVEDLAARFPLCVSTIMTKEKANEYLEYFRENGYSVYRDKWCDECNAHMTKGYVIAETEKYCSDKCLHKNYSDAEFKEMYDNDKAYWTEWKG